MIIPRNGKVVKQSLMQIGKYLLFLVALEILDWPRPAPPGGTASDAGAGGAGAAGAAGLGSAQLRHIRL
jgi:hypothetical protein